MITETLDKAKALEQQISKMKNASVEFEKSAAGKEPKIAIYSANNTHWPADDFCQPLAEPIILMFRARYQSELKRLRSELENL